MMPPQVIVNRHANQICGLPLKGNGFHFGLRDKQWRNTRDSREFFEHPAN